MTDITMMKSPIGTGVLFALLLIGKNTSFVSDYFSRALGFNLHNSKELKERFSFTDR